MQRAQTTSDGVSDPTAPEPEVARDDLGGGLRIVHYYPRALIGDGGCTAAVRGWAHGLSSVGADVLLVADLEGDVPQSSGGVAFEQVPHRGPSRLRRAVGLQEHLEGADLLMLHSGWVYHNVDAARWATRLGVPYTITPHGAYDPHVFARRSTAKRLWWGAFEERLLRDAVAVHVSFEGERKFLEGRYRGPTIVAPYGFSAPPLEEERRSDDGFVLWLGRFDIEHKGIDLLLHAIGRVPREIRPRLRLHGPDFRGGKHEAEGLVAQLGLSDHVTIGEPIYGEEKRNALRTCSLFVFPSRWDSNSVATLEAASAGVPIVATATTFIGETLAQHGAAVLVDADPDALAEGIVFANSPEGKRIGQKAARFVRDRFSWPSVATSFVRQLRPLL